MWMDKKVSEAWLTMGGETQGRVFTRQDMKDKLGVSMNYTDVMLNRLKGDMAIQQIGRGEYRVVEAGKWAGVVSMLNQAPASGRAVHEISERVDMSNIGTMSLYGSYAYGKATKQSDVDLILVTSPVHYEEVKQNVDNMPPRMKPSVHTPAGLLATAKEDPLYILYATAKPITAFDKGALRDAEGVALDLLTKKKSETLGRYLSEARKFLSTSEKLVEERGDFQLVAYFLVHTLRNLVMVSQVLDDRIDPATVNERVRELLGNNYTKLYSSYRAEKVDKQRKPPDAKKIKKALAIIKKTLEQIKHQKKQ